MDVRWAPRLRPEKLRRLYETDARGILDEDLVDEVAYALYSRCESILTVTESIWGKTQCPGCGIIILSSEWQLQCPGCGWQAAREEYHKSWEHQQLNGTNAIEIFREYVRRLPQAVRSLHPAKSVAAVGPRAAELLADHARSQLPFDIHSPFHKLIAAR
ncbi:MAG TPA: AAC(3) family N-acetyltransferase, partial [Candidatus Dormibacteraeota bacterium]|nr:AAC(3) family N-acetyltransferase [Candidatus Dormibacteraeota bacterium]